jgi:hypothetical protein
MNKQQIIKNIMLGIGKKVAKSGKISNGCQGSWG